MTWTRFMDMNSGGGRKLAWPYIYIEAPEAEAKSIFFARFKRNPERVTCTCCGNDYSLDEESSLEQATAYDRGCAYAYFNSWGVEVPEETAWTRGVGMVNGCYGAYAERKADRSYGNPYKTLAEYLKEEEGRTVLVIRAAEITEDERRADVPEEGYVWAGE